MFDRMRSILARFLPLLSIVCCGGSDAVAADAAWHVGKSSGEVWVSTSGAQQTSLTNDAILKPGDNIRTGRTGRVLLVRGDETILISPNSLIGLPAERTSGLSTIIFQQAGSILLDVEKRNDNHFEVETPYLAALVKGTQFSVTVNPNDARVDVLRGQVEVTEYRSGQHALVLPGQAANVPAQGPAGLSLSGSGTFNPILNGAPRGSSVTPAEIPKDDPPAPGRTAKGPDGRIAPLPDEAASVPAASRGIGPIPASSQGEKSVPASSRGFATGENTWASNLLMRHSGGSDADSRGNRDDQRPAVMAIPIAVGFTVAIAVAVKRRWPRRKKLPYPLAGKIISWRAGILEIRRRLWGADEK